MTARVLVVDNYDSFVFNLVQYLRQLEAAVSVWRNDDPRLADPDGAIAEYDGVLVSPGPSSPEKAGASIPVVLSAARQRKPLLGVCLGHQAIGVAFGGVVGRAPELLHGKTSKITHTDSGVFAGLPQGFIATRYHSLSIQEDTLPSVLAVTARSESGVIMGVAHRELPVQGVQFHPESILTQGGHRMLANWLGDCGRPVEDSLVRELAAHVLPA
ncbi:glutamine amidotransferase of anthranilate synthase [Segniliparus rotundus DSM 44985]|uniref:Glutamine amidotransferase of anthranilate synthase n=1 Tax=Segniliparus rotundus (strain ATCC BAA-972 / CDC 1076 / CIP 108378 / DSM 44985 / JCM 13578) TaxID=640132 RepID=D6ZB55_SEGRD|nr:aminodeoxychorismate/anthranilate synthase component II [Segniliparus rotundus]ADG96814.1 glutamine amidotransferase of anthranilate synthase [Segniliparus rotundus DSM 44985]